MYGSVYLWTYNINIIYSCHRDGSIGGQDCKFLDIVTWRSGADSADVTNDYTIGNNAHSIHGDISSLERTKGSFNDRG